MSRPHYLMIVEKAYVARMFEKVLNKMENEGPLNFDIDIIPANNHVVDVKAACTLSISADCNARTFAIGDMNIPENYQVLTSDYLDGITAMAKAMIVRNNYDTIINACSNYVEGDLKFEYMLVSIGMENCATYRFNVPYFTEDCIASEFAILNDR